MSVLYKFNFANNIVFFTHHIKCGFIHDIAAFIFSGLVSGDHKRVSLKKVKNPDFCWRGRRETACSGQSVK